MQRIPVYVVIPPRLMLLDIAGPIEVLRRANREQKDIHFDVRYIGPARKVLTSIGVVMAAIDPMPPTLPESAIVIVPGDVDRVITLHTADDFAATKADMVHQSAIVKWLRDAVQPTHKIVSICSGALLLAQAGLLDGYSCTTHHLCCQELATIAPRAKVIENRLYVEDGNRYSSAGVTAGIDLMLHFVGQLTNESCAAAIARYLVVYLRRSGSDPQMSPWLEGRNHIHPAVHRVQDAITRNPEKSWSLTRLAKIAGASNRHLSRLFHEHVGMSITDYRNRLRAALARQLISQMQLDIENAAERAGFGSTRQLRRAWRRLYGTTPKHARERA